MFLQHAASPSVIYFGKLCFNVILTLVLTYAVTILYLFVFPTFVIRSWGIFFVSLTLGSIGFASGATIIAAIIAKAHSKGTLYPVLSFPILLPLLLIVMQSTARSLDGETFMDAAADIQMLIAYALVVIGGSFILFDSLWKE
jgi:heme exporter protein B